MWCGESRTLGRPNFCEKEEAAGLGGRSMVGIEEGKGEEEIGRKRTEGREGKRKRERDGGRKKEGK